jgi:hypothetical protein
MSTSNLHDLKPDFGKLEVEPGIWDAKTEAFLTQAYHDEISLKLLKENIQNKRCDLLNITENGEHVSSLVIQIDQNENLTELVLLALGGSAGGRILATVNAFADRYAKSINADSIRAHIANKQLSNAVERFGYEASEMIYRKPIQS